MTAEDLEQRIKTLEKDTRVLKRLYFIRYRYEGYSVQTAAEKVGVYKMVAYQWQDRWNEDGYAGLMPRFAGGKPAKISPERMERLRSILQERDDWTTEEVQDLIEKRFGIRFTQKHVRTILRNIGMKYAKSYQHDYRRPKNAEDDLKKT
jgi:putative transposase